MKKWYDYLLKKDWFKGVIIFLPFTIIANPFWCAFLFMLYVGVGVWYVYTHY